MNISLPQSMKDHVEGLVRRGEYATPSEYVRSLIRADQRREAEAALQVKLLEGLGSGEAVPADSSFWKKRRQVLLRRRKQTA
ncbi:MAG TPA: type II toxin-antitoxin system ParD family antitoxin [Bryobacteraceae bacterium]|nr:type II toxin-antitoxin system ParD family antitoxin [Bryobacteraceae bacterium]